MSTLRKWNVVIQFGAVASFAVVGLFLIGLSKTVSSLAGFSTTEGWYTLLQDNWLVMLFTQNMGQGSSLYEFNILDFCIILLFCLISSALAITLKDVSKIGSFIAGILPFLGIPLFIMTGTAGRSTLLLSGLIISLVMLWSKDFKKWLALIGILASMFLFFAGDIATAIFSSSIIISAFILAGYILWILWFIFVAFRLWRITGPPAAELKGEKGKRMKGKV